MTSLSPRALLSLGLLVGFVAGCASRRVRREPVSNTTVTAEDIQKNPTEPIEKVLQAKVPGVWVTRTPDGGIAVQLRGSSSFYGETQPLYVIAGVPIAPGPGETHNGNNPDHMETTKDMKEPNETAVCGMR